MIAQGHIKLSLPVFLSVFMCSIHVHTMFVCVHMRVKFCSLINRAQIQPT